MTINFGCPLTEMVTRLQKFEDYCKETSLELNFSIAKNSPHYQSRITRIEYFKWETTKFPPAQ